MKTSMCSALLAGMLLHGVGAAESNPPEREFTGKVVTADSQPIAGAVAEIYGYAGLRTGMDEIDRVTTDANGIFKAKVPPQYGFALVRKEGYAPAWLSLRSQETAVERQFVLSSPTNFVGVVQDEAGTPVPDAEVWAAYALLEVAQANNQRSYQYLSGEPARKAFSTRTGADGRFVLGGFPTNAMALLFARGSGKVLAKREIESLGPDTMTRPGDEEIKLALVPAGRVQGIVTTESGEPLAGVIVWMQPQGGGFLLPPDPVETGADGAFGVTNVAEGGYVIQAHFGTNKTAELVIPQLPVSVAFGETTGDIKLVATQGGLLEVTIRDDKGEPASAASIAAHGEKGGQNSVSDKSGKALLLLVPGSYTLSAYKENARSENQAVTVEAGATNRVEMQFQPRPKIAGTVFDPAGKAVTKVRITLFPNWGGVDSPVTDERGRYELLWDPRQFGSMDRNFSLIAQDEARNLAVAEEIDESTRALELHLQPALVITGRIEDPDGKPLTNGAVSVTLWAGNMGSSFRDQSKADSNGQFKVSCLPQTRRYSINASAPGYGSANQQVQEGAGEGNQVQLEPFVLRLADRDFAGQVIDQDEKPVSGANVSIQGDGQPYVHVLTDKDGRFAAKVCEGMVRIWANARNSHGNLTAEAGDTNVVLQLQSYSSVERVARRRVPLKGRPLPDLAPLGFSANAAGSGPVLLCLFDSEQRPSRHVIRTLGERHDVLQKKVTVLGVQAAVVSSETLQEWRDANPLPFPVGCFPEETPDVKWVKDAESLPWFILTDAEHKIIDEGFTLDELDAKLETLAK
ncbi:MAG: carboxypeptidase regulatory-like domain-containing protein [Verrucomicrobiia bacterium]